MKIIVDSFNDFIHCYTNNNISQIVCILFVCVCVGGGGVCVLFAGNNNFAYISINNK